MCHLAAPVGAIVRVWFPETEDVMSAGSKFRPCLVLAGRQTNHGVEVLVAYGTSQNTQARGIGEFTVAKDLQVSIEKDTKFCLTRRIWLPLTKNLFCINGRQPAPEMIHAAAMVEFHRAAREAKIL